MKNKIIISLSTLSLLCIAIVFNSCKTNEKRQSQFYVPQNNDRYTTFITDVPVIINDVIYDTSKKLGMDIYMSETTNDAVMNRPCIILMHGGGYINGDKATDNLTKAFSIDMARMGYVVCNVNYSLSDKADKVAVKKACTDIANAIDWIQKNCDTYKIDPHHITLGGYSAGAGIAINVAYSNKYKVNMSDIVSVMDIAGGGLYSGKPKNSNPPCMIFHGRNDTTVKLSDSEKFAKSLNKADVVNNLYIMEDISHTVITRFDEMRNEFATFLYKNLTGKEVSINLKSKTNPEYKNVMLRKQNGPVYKVNTIECNLDGCLDEWSSFQKIELDKPKDSTTSIPNKDDFSGYAYIGWNEANKKIYIAVSITDDTIFINNNSDAKWYNDDCLEIVFDLSDDENLEQLMKWVISADGNKLSVLANQDNTKTAIRQNGKITTYEIEIDLNKVGCQVLNRNTPFVISKDTTIGFSIAYNDSTDKRRRYQIGWTEGSSSDRCNMGNLEFVFPSNRGRFKNCS